MLKTVRKHLQYRFDDLFSRGSWGKFLLLLAFTVSVILFGMLAYFCGLFAPENAEVEGINHDIDKGFWDTLWWSSKHIFDPAYFSSNYGASVAVLAVSLVISISGMVIFGTLIGFISSSIEERLEALRRGNSAVMESGHSLILGWNGKAFELISLLAASRRRPRVVILAPRDVSDMQESLRASGAYGLGAKIVLRSGSTANHAELARVACADARNVIVLSTPSTRGDGGDDDIEAVKTVLSLSSFPWKQRRPKVACEIAQARSVDIALAASGGLIPIVSSGEAVSRLIFQASRQSGIAQIYDRICSFAGVGIYFRSFPACEGMRFGDAAYAFPKATLIGISSLVQDPRGGAETYRFTLSPHRKRIIAARDWLIFLALSDDIADDLKQPIYRSEVSNMQSMVSLPGVPVNAGHEVDVYVSDVARSERYLAPTRERILVLGWNANVHELLAEHDACIGAETEVTLVSGHGSEEALELLDKFAPTRLKPVFVRGDALARGALEGLSPHVFDSVVVLADASHGDQDSDARTVMTLVLLKKLLTGYVERPRVVAELLDSENEAVVSALAVDDLVISPRVVSQQLVQISQQAMLADVYRELLSSGGVEIYLKPASRYVKPGRCCFKDLVYSSQRVNEVALGVRIASRRCDADGGIELNPAKSATWEFQEGDMVIVIAEELYDRHG